MSREIEFRAWDTNQNKYIKTGTVEVLGMEKLSPNYFFTDKYLKHIVWEQYTGLKDKNGKKIYEGDIIKCNEDLGIVFWEEDYGMYAIEYINGTNDYLYPLNNWQLWEVIGNIHENPELLK